MREEPEKQRDAKEFLGKLQYKVRYFTVLCTMLLYRTLLRYITVLYNVTIPYFITLLYRTLPVQRYYTVLYYIILP